ncbi:hypothetical protein [Sphaerotilus sp.]|jgi:hypothetical protein|uniref:hypothetical protein n=1 Tax=Sphaerotilus sp. TaxID=2093942 RepID=UPI0025E898B3|nr:hypothetical protein [Sphaerotilus sp.]
MPIAAHAAAHADDIAQRRAMTPETLPRLVRSFEAQGVLAGMPAAAQSKSMPGR